MSWTEPLKQRLKVLWADGSSASQIAGELGNGITRNAVIGQVHRMGLNGRARHSGQRIGSAESSIPERIARRTADIARTASQPGRRLPSHLKAAAASSASLHAPTVATSAKPIHRTESGGGLQQKIAARLDHEDEELETIAEAGGATDLPPDESPFAVTFAAVTADQCRHPLGDPSNLDTFRFCGAPKVDGCPYCLRHRALNWNGFGRPSAPSRRGQPPAPFSANPIDPFN